MIVRDWHEILRYDLTAEGRCDHRDARLPGHFGALDGRRGHGRRRIPVRLAMNAPA
ncbi:MAG: hypothetical protein WCB48_10650 [Casimicrobiaceae bacterium]